MKYLLLLLVISCATPKLKQDTITVTTGEFAGCIGLIKDVEIREQFVEVVVRCPLTRFETRTTITIPLEYLRIRTIREDESTTR